MRALKILVGLGMMAHTFWVLEAFGFGPWLKLTLLPVALAGFLGWLEIDFE